MSQLEVNNRPLQVGILTVSDTRTEETDKGGQKVQEFILQANHKVVKRTIVPDDYDCIQDVIKKWIGQGTIDAIITTGGTGIAIRDVTIEAVSDLVKKEIPGFGEIFRYLSYEDIGSRAIASRAFAGVLNHTIIFSLPGSVGAVSLGMSKLVIPELAHAVYEINK